MGRKRTATQPTHPTIKLTAQLLKRGGGSARQRNWIEKSTAVFCASASLPGRNKPKDQTTKRPAECAERLNNSNTGPITTDFDETRWDLIPPISFVIPLFNRSAHSAGPMLLVCLVVWWFGRLVSSSWKGRGRAEDGRTFLNPVALPRRSATAFQQLGRTSQRKP